MDDETFLAFIRNSAAKYDLETLEKAVRALGDNIASRHWGKPPGLEVGSNVAAVDFDGFFGWYGTIVRMTGQGCVIAPPASKYTQRISFKKFIVRVVDEGILTINATVIQEIQVTVRLEAAGARDCVRESRAIRRLSGFSVRHEGHWKALTRLT